MRSTRSVNGGEREEGERTTLLLLRVGFILSLVITLSLVRNEMFSVFQALVTKNTCLIDSRGENPAIQLCSRSSRAHFPIPCDPRRFQVHVHENSLLISTSNGGPSQGCLQLGQDVPHGYESF
jgi:hypothetical protein